MTALVCLDESWWWFVLGGALGMASVIFGVLFAWELWDKRKAQR